MMINELGMISLTIYSLWKFWNLQKRAIRIIDNPKEQTVFVFDIIYAIVMVYFLVSASPVFILIAISSFIFHLLLGLYGELFKPELRLSDVITSFWRFLILDTFITASVYFIMIFGGTV